MRCADEIARTEPTEADRLTCMLALVVAAHLWILATTTTEPEKQNAEICIKNKGEERTNQEVKRRGARRRKENELTGVPPTCRKAQITMGSGQIPAYPLGNK